MSSESSLCSDARLRDLLACNDRVEPALVEHVESCPRCQSRLSELAATEDDWHDTRNLLAVSDADAAFTAEARERSWSDAHGAKPAAWTETMARQLLGPPSHPEMLGRLGRYEVERLIGSGGMGIVFKGFDTELNRPVAIKVLAPHLAGSGAARQRFSREARAAAAVVHEHVVAIHNVESGAAAPFLVMQYVAGESLQARLDRQGPLALTEILRIAHQTASGLAAAHAQGLVHRDVKPSNIMLEQGIERALLTDFGLARAADDASLTHTGYLPGTPHYMSPEQARGDAIDASSDLFSLGGVLYAMCTGRPPFRADTSFGVLRRITDTEARPIREINPDVPGWFTALIDKLLAKQPADRFTSAAEVANLLEQCLAHVQQPAAVALPISCRVGFAHQRPLDRRRIFALASIGLLFAISAATYLANSQRTTQPSDRTGSLAIDQPSLADESPSELDWEQAAKEIQTLSGAANSLEQRAGELWDDRPVFTPAENPSETIP